MHRETNRLIYQLVFYQLTHSPVATSAAGVSYLMARATAGTTPFSNGPGIIFCAVGFLTRAARFFAALSFISSVISLTPWSMAPRNTPGKTSELLIWFGKSERPVATTA